MSLNAPLDKSSDKSSDSGGLLDLSSRALSEGEDTWLFTMEAKMKDMKLIEEEEIPDDLLSISQGSLSDVDEDSLDGPEATKPITTDQPPLLLEDIDCETKTACTSPSCTVQVQSSPNTHATDQPPPLTTPSCCSEAEPTSDAQMLMDDFGFSINVAAPQIVSNSPCILMDEKEEKREEEKKEEAPTGLVPSPSEPNATTDAPQSLLDDFGFNINVAAAHTDSDSPCIVMDEKGEEREEEEAPTDLVPSPPQPNATTDAPQSLLDDFGFNINVAAAHTDNDSPCIVMDEKGEEREEEEAPNDLVPSPPEPTTTTDAPQSLLDDFGFNIRLSSPHKGRELPNRAHRRSAKSHEVSPSSEQKTKYLMRFDTDLSITHSKKKLTTVNWSPNKAQILMEFDSNLTPSDTGMDTPPSTEMVARALDNPVASPRLTEKSSGGQNLSDDFRFKVDLRNPLIDENSIEQRNEAQNLLDDFGFESNTCTSTTPVGNEMDIPIANTSKAVIDEPLVAPPSTDVSANTQALLDDFGFDINVSALHMSEIVPDAHTANALPSSNDTPSKVVPLIAFSSDTVHLWEAKQKENKITRHRNQSPGLNKTDDQMQTPSEAISSETPNSMIGESVDRTVTSEKSGEDDGDSAERKTNCSPLLASPVKCSPVEELGAQGNGTFTMSDRSTPSSLDQDIGEIAVQPSSSDGILTSAKSNSSSADHDETHNLDPQSLNSSISSEHSQALSICSSVSVASVKEPSRGGETGGTTSAAAGTNSRKMAGKIPKPVSKNRPNIKPSLLPSKSATSLSKAPGAASKLQAPSSRLMKPKATSNPSTKNGLSKPSELKQPTSRLTTTTTTLSMAKRSSKLLTAKTSRDTTLKQSTMQRGQGQPRSKMAAPSAALRKKKVIGGATENPTTTRKQPWTASTPIVTSNESGGGATVSPRTAARANDTFTVNSTSTASSSSTSSSPATSTSTATATGSTPKTSKRGRRSLIPTPLQDRKAQHPKTIRDAAGGGSSGISVGGAVPSGVFKPRNGPNQTNGCGTVKSKVATLGGSKVVHSPVDKENRPATPHSKWSPVRRKKPLNFEEACIQCTKKVK